MKIIVHFFLVMFIWTMSSAAYAGSDFFHSHANLIVNLDQAFEAKFPAVALELQPVVIPKHALKLANVRFIVGDERQEMTFDVAALCAQNGFAIAAESCGADLAGAFCPYSTDYTDKCFTPQEWCLNNNYTLSSCPKPQYPASACPKDEALFRSCEIDNARACEEDGYFLTCELGQIADSGSCPYDDTYHPCICNPCEGYAYTAEEANAQGYQPFGAVCNSCGTMKYMRLPADCGDKVECDCGGIGTACWSGTKKLYESCQSCYVPCPSGQLDRNYYWCGEALQCFLPSVN